MVDNKAQGSSQILVVTPRVNFSRASGRGRREETRGRGGNHRGVHLHGTLPLVEGGETPHPPKEKKLLKIYGDSYFVRTHTPNNSPNLCQK
jgi:hypothetical protein